MSSPGVGRWRFFEQGGVTAVVYEWNVETTARWMNVLAPLGRPAFEWNHDRVMQAGGEGLASCSARGCSAPPDARPVYDSGACLAQAARRRFVSYVGAGRRVSGGNGFTSRATASTREIGIFSSVMSLASEIAALPVKT